MTAAPSPYEEFIASKIRANPDHGFNAEPSPMLYPFQQEIVRWALKKGRAAIFADCGLGKTPMQLDWAHNVATETGGRVLILAPLAVSSQTAREGHKFGVPVTVCREPADVREGVNVCNYERLHRFQDMTWAGVVLDESSILKAFDGKTRTALTQWAQTIPMRLCCTATPSPNDYEELGGHSEFLGLLARRVMLAEFFVNDGLEAAHWRLKGHAGGRYWQWIVSWAKAIRAPSDMGYPDEGFALPPLTVETVSVDADAVSEDRLFAVPVASMLERRQARRESISERVEIAHRLVTEAWDKLAVCGRPNTPCEGGSDTSRIQPSANGDSSSRDRQRRTRSTCEPTTSPIQTSSPSDQPSSETSTTANGESGTRTTPSTENESRDNPASHPKREGSLAVDSSSGSPESSTPQCSTRKEAVAPSADPPPGFTSTTATKQGRSEGSSAPSATLVSASSGTIQTVYPALGDISTRHDPEAWVIWCDLNDEQAALEKAFGDRAISIYGTLSIEEKESRMLAWLAGDRPVLISKPQICAWGINMQRCANVLFVGLSDSYEQYYQAVRRCWRFGQTEPVRVVIVASNREQAVLENVRRKEKQALEMFAEIVEAMNAQQAG